MSEELAPTEGQAAVPPSWADTVGSFEDQELSGWSQNKNFESPEKMAGSYRELERLMGHDRAGRTIVKPGDNASADEVSAYQEKLGRPTEADGYNIPVPEGESADFANFAQGMFFDAGLSTEQANSLVEKWGGYLDQSKEAQGDEYQASVEADEAALHKDWGQDYDKNIVTAQNAAKAFGFDGETIDKLEKSLGYAGLMGMMHKMGSKIGEDNFEGGANNTDFGGNNPNRAKSELSDLKNDPIFRGRLVNGDKDAQAKWDRLHRVAYGNG